MRKAEREIKDFNQIVDLIKNTNTIRLGLNDSPYPYVVPVSFGFEVIDEQINFYFHGAKVGKKVQLVEQNPNVCVEGDICHRFMDTINSVTCLYESFIAFGKCQKLNGQDAIYGLQKILEHCGYGNHSINEKAVDITAVFKIEINSITAKHRQKN